MPISNHFVASAEAAYIAGLNDRQMNRVVDEHLVPASLLAQDGPTRLFTRLGAAFAGFYFGTEQLFVARARLQVLEELTARIEQLHAHNDVFNLLEMPKGISWKVMRSGIEIDMLPFVTEALIRAREVHEADDLVTVDPEIMDGAPCFSGTRVPIEIVLSSLESGVDMDRLRSSYRFLTDTHVAAARVYAQVHPRRGRPRRLFAENPPALARPAKVLRPVKA